MLAYIGSFLYDQLWVSNIDECCLKFLFCTSVVQITQTDLAEAIGASLLQSIGGGYTSVDMFIKSVRISLGSVRLLQITDFLFMFVYRQNHLSSTCLIGQVIVE